LPIRVLLARLPAILSDVFREILDQPGLAAQLVDEYPHVHVVAVTPDARSAFLYSLRPELVALGTATPERLLAAIRAAGGAELPGGGSGPPTGQCRSGSPTKGV
jgi:hypothetical protein